MNGVLTNIIHTYYFENCDTLDKSIVPPSDVKYLIFNSTYM